MYFPNGKEADFQVRIDPLKACIFLWILFNFLYFFLAVCNGAKCARENISEWRYSLYAEVSGLTTICCIISEEFRMTITKKVGWALSLFVPGSKLPFPVWWICPSCKFKFDCLQFHGLNSILTSIAPWIVKFVRWR